MSDSTAERWDQVITPQRNWRDINLREVWEYRSLIALMVRRNFAASYKQTILGPLWHLINPILSTLVYIVIFDRIAGLPTDELPPFLFYLSGTVIWTFFAGSLTGTANVFSANATLFGKVYFPRLVMPLAMVTTNMLTVSIRLGMFILFLVYFILAGFPAVVSWAVILVPLLILLASGLGMGMGMIISSLTTKYRDLTVFVGYGVQLLMYASPILYPASLVPAQFLPIYQMNPMVSVIEAFRYVFMGSGVVSLPELGYSIVVMIVLMVAGLVLFNKTEANFLDTV